MTHKFIVFVVCFVIAVGTTAQSSDDVIASAASQYMGTNYITELHRSEINAAPKWDGAAAPPLSVDGAVSNACRHLEDHIAGALPRLVASHSRIRNIPNWTPTAFEMHEFDHSDRWYYRLEMRPLIDNSYNWPPVFVFVTMDGKVSRVHVLDSAARK